MNSNPTQSQTPNERLPHVVIVGGGITGLAAANYLEKKAQETGTRLRYTLLERGPVRRGSNAQPPKLSDNLPDLPGPGPRGGAAHEVRGQGDHRGRHLLLLR